MKLRIFATLDSRLTFGLGDEAFGRTESVVDPSSCLHAGFEMKNPLGRGMTIAWTSSTNLYRTWVAAALRQLEACTVIVRDFPKIERDRAPLLRAAAEAIERGPRSLMTTLFGIGAAWLDSEWVCSLPTLDVRSQQIVASLVYRAAEQSAYSEQVSTVLLDAVDQMIESRHLARSPLCRITKRAPPQPIAWDIDGDIQCSTLLESFTLCVVAENPAEHDLAAGIVTAIDDQSGPPKILGFQREGDVVYGWAAIAICPSGAGYTFATNEQFFLQLLKIANTQLEASRLVENLLAQRLTLSVQGSAEGLLLSGADLGRLRALAASISDRTTSRAVSLRSDVREFLDLYADDAKTNEHNASISEKGAALYAVYRDLLLDSDGQRAERASAVLSSLTILTLASVISDVVGSLDFKHDFFDVDDWRFRAWVVLVPTFLAALVFFWVVKGCHWIKAWRRGSALEGAQTRWWRVDTGC